MGTGYQHDITLDRSSKEATVFNSLPPWFGCFCYLLVGLSVSLVYVLGEVDYLMLSGVFRAQRFFSDDPFYFSKQVLIVYGFVGFLVTILVGPIGRLPCVLWSWALSSAYFCLSFYVFLYSFSQYGRFMMLALALLSLLSHVLLANFVFFLFDAGAYNFRLPRCFAFLIGFFAGSPLVSFVLFRLKLCFTTSSSYEFKLKTFDIFRLFATLFSLAMLSSLCLTYEFFAYGDNNYRIEWAPAKRVRAPVRAIAQFVDGEVIVLLFLLCPMWVDLGQYAAKSHGDWVEARLGHKAMFAVALILLLLWTFASAWQLCVQTINEINAAIFKVMFTDGYDQLMDDNMKDRPVSITPLPNYKPDCSNAENKIKNTLTIPGPVMYPYMQDTWDDAENEDKLMLSMCLRMLNGLDSISHFLASGSTAELCKLTTELRLQDCWLESQDPLKLIGYVVSEYNNTLSYMVANSLNLHDTSNSCSEINIQYFKYLLHSYSYHKQKFPSLFDEDMKCTLNYFKCRYRCDIRWIWYYVCCFIKHLKCLKTPIQTALSLVCNIEQKIDQIEVKIGCLLQELKFSYVVDFVLKHFTRISTTISQLESLSKKLSLCKQNICEIKSSLEECSIDSAISQLKFVKYRLCELYRTCPRFYTLVSTIEDIVETLRSVSQLVSPFTELLVKLETLKVSLEYSMSIGFLVHENIEIKLRLYIRFISRMLKTQNYMIGLNIEIATCKSYINQLNSNLCKAPLKSDEFCSIYNCIMCYTTKLQCKLDKIKTTENNIAKSLNLSIYSNTNQLKDLIQCDDNSRPFVSNQKGPDVRNQSVITIRSALNHLLWLLLSHTAIVESKIVVSRLCSALQEGIIIFDNIRCVNYCCCCDFKSKYTCCERFDFIYCFSIYRMINDRYKILNCLQSIHKYDKHMCLCLIIKHILYPRITLCLCNLVDIELQISGLLSRKYDKYTMRISQDCYISKMLIVVIELCLKITNWVRSRYICICGGKGYCCKRDIKTCNPSCLVCISGFNIACNCKQNSQQMLCSCFCKCSGDRYYMFFISLILYICSLIDNLTNMDNIAVQHITQKLSLLMLEFYGSDCDLIKSIRVDCTDPSDNNETHIYINNSIVQIFLILSNSFLLFDASFHSFSIRSVSSNLSYSFSEKEMTKIIIAIPKTTPSYQEFFNFFFYLLNEDIRLENKSIIATINSTIAKRYLLTCQNNNDSICLTNNKSALCCRCIALARYFINLCGRQILNAGMIKLSNNKGEVDMSNNIAKDMMNESISYSNAFIRLNRNTRILDATCSLSNTSQQRLTDMNPKYYVSDKVFRPSACFGFGYFKFVITRFFLVVFLILMFWFLRFRFDPFVPGAFSQLRNYDYAATSAYLTSLIAKSQNAANSQSPSDVADTSGVRDAANVGIAKPRLKKAKHFVLIGAFAAVSAVYITLVIRDIYVAVTVDFATLSYLINVAIVCGMFMTVFIKYFIHLYDFVQVLQRYGVKLTRASTFLDTAANGGSHAVMLLSLVKTMGADLSSLAMLKRPTPSASSYSDMKNTLYPYNIMSPPVRRMTTADNDHLKELENLRASVLASLGDAKKIDDRTNRTGKKADKSPGTSANTLDLHSVLDFLSYVLMSKTSAFHYHTFSADDAYLSWRLGRPLNHNFFLLAYARYSAVYELYARTQSFNFGQFYTAEQNCNRLWRAFGDAQIDSISLKCMAEDTLPTPMTELQTQMLKTKITEEYLHSFLGFQAYVATTVFGVKDKSAGLTTDSLFPFVDAFNKVELDHELVTRLASKFFGDNQRKVSAGVAVPSSTCSVDGDAQRVRDRLKDSCAEWLDKKRHCCESLAGAGCDCIVHRAHDMVLRAIAEPGDVRNNIVTLVAGLNLEDVEVFEKSFETDVGAKRALKDYTTTLLEHRLLDAVSEGYESTVTRYLNQYLVGSYENRDRAAVPLGLYMQWHGAPLCDHHLRNVDKFDHFM